MNEHLDAMLFKAYYIARWSSYIPTMLPLQQQDWYEVLGVTQPNGTHLVDIFSLKEAQVAELNHIWNIPWTPTTIRD